ncbi:MAG: hypothetical protein RIT81_02355 [Deltaproteobacteria bacterium]
MKSTVVWRPTISGADGNRVDVVPHLFPHLATPDGDVDQDKLMELFSRVTRPSPDAPGDDVLVRAGAANLPQLILDVRGRKTVFTIGALCSEYSGPTSTPVDTNDLGWTLLDAGAYVGVSILELRLDELLDDASGEPVRVERLKREGRIEDDAQPSLRWRAFSTEYGLSSFESTERGPDVLAHVERLFARDAVFDFIANDAALAPAWATASLDEDGASMNALFDEAIEGLNVCIRAGAHTVQNPILKDTDGVPNVTAKDYVRTAIQRSARNIVVLHALGLVHGAIVPGEDVVNAAWQLVDLARLKRRATTSPRDHDDVHAMAATLGRMITDVQAFSPDVADLREQVRELLLQAIDREAPIFGAATGDPS